MAAEYELARVFAFAVAPARKADGSQSGATAPPPGGPVALTVAIAEIVAKAFGRIPDGVSTTVEFECERDRSHPVRDDMMVVAFGATTAPRAAAARLAARLAAQTDNRTQACMLVVAVEVRGATRRVSLLVLPREDVVQMHPADEEIFLNVLTNAFSTGSGLRKFARAEGHNAPSQFLAVEVLDFQMSSGVQPVADFWIRRFLRARPAVDSKTGTLCLVSGLQRALAAVDDEDDKDQVLSEILAASSGRMRRVSLGGVAAALPDVARAAFTRAQSEHVLAAVFDVDRALVRAKLGRRVFTGADGVVVSAPQDAVGESVKIAQRGREKTIAYRGTVTAERFTRDGRQK